MSRASSAVGGVIVTSAALRLGGRLDVKRAVPPPPDCKAQFDLEAGNQSEGGTLARSIFGGGGEGGADLTKPSIGSAAVSLISSLSLDVYQAEY